MRTFPANVVLDRNDLRALGCAGSTLARAVRDGRLVRLRAGFFATPDSDDTVRILAAARACTGAAISNRSALWLDGLPIVGPREPLPELTVAPASHTRLAKAHLYRASMRAADIRRYSGLDVLSPARTLVDVGRHQSRTMTVAAADFALHNHLVTQAEIDDVLRFCWNWPGIGRATRALSLTDARAESPLESLSRLLFIDLDLPTPVPQLVIADEHERFVARADFGWDWLGVVGEADGMGKYRQRSDTQRTPLSEEKLRQERLEQLGLVVVRWDWTDVTRRPQQLRSRILAGFNRAADLRRSGLLPRWRVLR